MPFAIFRRHQRKLLAVFGILAMMAFVLSDTLYRFSSGGSSRNANPVVVTLWGKTYRQGDLYEMKTQRGNANAFMTELVSALSKRAMPPSQYFGDLSEKSIVDAIILEHEADTLRMPRTKDVAQEWLRALTGGTMTKELFEAVLARFNNKVSGEQILTDIANQVRIANVRGLLGSPVVTPLDVFQAYRDQNERVSVQAVEFRAEDYVHEVKGPSDSELRAYYNQYKDLLPDPARETPGFKIPRKIKVEILSIDGTARARQIQNTLTDPELLTSYENRKAADFVVRSEFPTDVFADDPKGSLTPPLHRPFAEVKTSVAVSLGEERAQAEIADKFNRIKEEAILPFADKYHEAEDNIAEAKKDGEAPTATLPKPPVLKAVADKEGLDYDMSPLLTRDEAEHYGQVHDAEYGSTRFSGGKKFAAEFFAPKSPLFDPVELTNLEGRRFLVRKVEDDAPRVPPLDEVRDEVVHAWKLEKARPLAEKAAHDYAAKLQKEGGKIKGDVADGHRVITTDPVSKLQPGILPGQFFATGPSTPTEIPQFPYAGESLREALFGLKEGDVAVAPNRPRTVYYVLTQNQRVPAQFDDLYAPNSDYVRYQREVLMTASKQRDEQWMNELRRQAKLPTDWAPAEGRKLAEDEGE